MKRLSDDINLSDQIETIRMMDFRAHPGEVMTLVSLGKTFIVRRKNELLAMLVHIPKDKLSIPGDNLSIVVDSKGNSSYKAEKVEL